APAKPGRGRGGLAVCRTRRWPPSLFVSTSPILEIVSPRRRSPRRKSSRGNRKYSSGVPDEDELMLRITGGQRRETGPDGEWVTRRIPGAAARSEEHTSELQS